MPHDATLDGLAVRLRRIYGERAEEALALIQSATSESRQALALTPPNESPAWTERNVVLITYADQLRSEGQSPLASLRDWLLREELDQLLSTVHLLPFFSSSSDDGFSVVDYAEVDPDVGGWSDVESLGDDFDLMFDLVLNHCSQRSDWFQRYLRGESPFDRFFVEADPSDDLSQVIRPRSSPLLTPFETSRGERHVWTTFSADQVDLNYAEPKLLAEMLRVLLEYVRRGARIVRLDAVAFLWKSVGTDCLHRTETHEVVRIIRDLLACVAPQVLVLTETNVPHEENVSYFGGGQSKQEAHMVYQFSLPPLLLDAFLNGDAQSIRQWLALLEPPPPGCTFFNFTASHDGVGVRPLEGLTTEKRLARLVKAIEKRGGRINTRRKPDGSDAPYELNISYVDALAPDEPDEDLHVRRFLASQAVGLSLQGMPAIYFHSLVGTRNDYQGLQESGQNRRINRHKYMVDELDAFLAPGDSLARRIYEGYQNLLAVRTAQPAFHPEAAQRLVEVAPPQLLAFERTSLDGAQRLLSLCNFGDEVIEIAPPEDFGPFGIDLIPNSEVGPTLFLEPGQAAWVTTK